MDSVRIGDEDYVSATQLAEERNVNRRSVYLAIENGHLPSMNVAGRVWVRKVEAEKWFPQPGPGRPKKQPPEAHGPGSGRE